MVELIPKKVPQIPRWLNIVFYFALLILFSSITSFFILGNSMKAGQSELQELRVALFESKTPERVALEKQILSYEKKIDDFSSLTSYHLENSNFFSLLEGTTHPKVWFSNINFDTEKGRVSFSGVTQSFESLGQQIFIFQNKNSIKEVNLEKISIDKTATINFSLSFSFDASR